VHASARADAPSGRPPFPEPIFGESVTDIDSVEPGEIELEIDGFESVARRAGSRLYQTSVEVEWKAWSRLGLRFEPTFESSRPERSTVTDATFGFEGAAAWGLVHDFARDFHLQVEAAGRFLDDGAPAFASQPGESPAPFTLDLKSALRLGEESLRASLGAEGGGLVAHAPIRVQGSWLHPFTSDLRYGSYGFEVDADFGRPLPVTVAPNVWTDVTPLGLPLELGVGIPIVLGASDTLPAAGVYLRLMILSQREAKFERGPGR
jgi:hypothetical protein